jgi:hypothetical protein
MHRLLQSAAVWPRRQLDGHGMAATCGSRTTGGRLKLIRARAAPEHSSSIQSRFITKQFFCLICEFLDITFSRR